MRYQKRIEKILQPFNEILEELTSIGYTTEITENEYINAREKFPGKCSRGHECQISIGRLREGKSCCQLCGKIKTKETNILNWGYESPMQNPEFFAEHQKSCFKKKIYTFPSGKTTIYQGYEHFCLNDLIFDEKFKEEEILNCPTEVPEIFYNFNGKKRRYYPDIYIKEKNLLIEVKSTYTFNIEKEKIMAKALRCKEMGFNFEFRIYNPKGKYEKIVL